MGELIHRLDRPQSLQEHGGPLRVAREGLGEDSEGDPIIPGTGGGRQEAEGDHI